MPRRPDMPALDRGDLDLDPIVQFGAWFDYARREVELPEAMTLATVDAGGAPDARMVLLKGVDERGFRLFTNRDSNKAMQIAASPRAALVVYWRELDRQVRVRGPISELDDEESDAYFASRPRDSQLGAWASPQSRPIASRTELDQHLDEVEARFADREVPRPPHWGGYLIEPEEVEFWQGRIGRLHDRFRYTRERSEWRIERLAP
jgi:pyridoxamine 5'-phosphate oxidase